MSYRVVVERNRLRFAAGHFATLANELEPIHGHNYDVIIEATGSLTEAAWVIDFSQLKKVGREICEMLDHKFLLQMKSSTLIVTDEQSHFKIQFNNQPSYRLPKTDVIALPIDNTTAERLAEFIAGILLKKLEKSICERLTLLKVGVEEMPGQVGWFETIPTVSGE